MSLQCRCVALIIGRSIAAAMKKHGGGTAEQIRLPPPARFGLEPIRWREWKPPPRTRRHSMGPIWHLNDDLPNSGREQSAPCSGLDRILRNVSETSARIGFPAKHELVRGVRPEFRDVASRRRVHRDIQ